MRGRIKGNIAQAITTAYHVEVFAREKRLKPLPHYLKPKAKPSRETGNRAVMMMLDKLAG